MSRLIQLNLNHSSPSFSVFCDAHRLVNEPHSGIGYFTLSSALSDHDERHPESDDDFLEVWRPCIKDSLIVPVDTYRFVRNRHGSVFFFSELLSVFTACMSSRVELHRSLKVYEAAGSIERIFPMQR